MESASVDNVEYGWSSSGYATCSSLSDEDVTLWNRKEEYDSRLYLKSDMGGKVKEELLHPGICPHCKFIYEKPVTLQCGHSLCDRCCKELLCGMENTSVPRTRPRMGISSFSRSSLNKAMTSSWNSLNGIFSLWKSPRCVVCGESPKKSPPVPNLSLRDFLTTLRLPGSLRQWQRNAIKGNELSPCELTTHLYHPCSTHCDSSRVVSIRDCLISIVGSKGVGKSCLLQTQLCNDMLVDELLERVERPIRHTMSPQSPLSDVYSLKNEEIERRRVTYMLKLMETCDLTHKIPLPMGVVVTYSIVDRESFLNAHSLLSISIAERGSEMPVVLIGTKSDLEKRRQVESYEGQMIAKKFNCPFIEVSSRRNECVNEAFIELVRLMESRNLLN